MNVDSSGSTVRLSVWRRLVLGITHFKTSFTDAVVHTVTQETGPGVPFNSGDVQPSDSFEITLDLDGTYTVGCTYHENLKIPPEGLIFSVAKSKMG